MNVRPIIDWLVAGAPGASTSPQVLARLGADLVAAGVPLDRAEAFVRTLHPHIAGRSFVFAPGREVEVREHPYAALGSTEFLASPLAEVFVGGGFARRRLDGRYDERERASLAALEADGYTDFLAAPLVFLSGQVHAITFATRAVGGFSDAHAEALMAVVPALSRIAEILALSRTAANLLSTYVGRNAGERILAGRIQRGDVDTLRAVLWFSDLRGFTSMASELAPGRLIRVLNDLFECQVGAIERRGGEVLKFMGDGLLAIFPLAEGDGDARARAVDALDAAREAFGHMATLNAARAVGSQAPLRFGLALHVGDIAYGNIGGAGRLDFTCIGPAVNLASRLEGVAGRLGEDVVVSDDFRRLVDRPMRALGSFELKGVPGAQAAYAPG
jgi:adenylate cyclase